MSFVHKLYLLIFKRAEIVRLEGSKTKRGREDRERSQQILRLLMNFLHREFFISVGIHCEAESYYE